MPCRLNIRIRCNSSQMARFGSVPTNATLVLRRRGLLECDMQAFSTWSCHEREFVLIRSSSNEIISISWCLNRQPEAHHGQFRDE